MMIRLLQLRKEVIATVLLSLSASLLLITWGSILKQPVAEYRQLAREKSELEDRVTNSKAIANAINNIRQEITALGNQLNGERSSLNITDMTAYVIGRLDKISGQHKVALVSVTPGPGNKVLMFEEIPFDIEVNGKYMDLYRWLIEVKEKLGPLVIRQFSIRPDNTGSKLTMRLKLASYRLTDGSS